jgi:4-hydroxy-tetrahydrodipicolinate synthase
MFKGIYSALITPFKDGELDLKAFDALIEWQIEQGIHGLVACGTTGESPCLSEKEHITIVGRCVDVVKGRIPVIAGTGTNNTSKTIECTQKALELGADAALIVTPYYNKPSQDGLFEHYKAVSDNVDIPVIIYNIPGRSIVDINADTMARIAGLPNMIGVKDATGDLSRITSYKKQIGDDFIQLTGEDLSTLNYLKKGGDGAISVTSNIAPALCSELYEAVKADNIDRANEIDLTLSDLHKALFSEPSPSPVKYGASQLGLCVNEVRLPLVTASAGCEQAVKDAMIKANLINEEQHEALKANG